MKLSGAARLAGVLGHPVKHSLSPRLHGHWLERYGLDGAYLPLNVAPDDLADVVKALPRMGFSGANVTVPHKEAVIALCDRLDETARRIGAVNTLVFGEDGIEGRNTDAFGFYENIRVDLEARSTAPEKALVLGAGGAARAVVFALAQNGFSTILIANRTRDKAERLSGEIAGEAIAWDEAEQAASGCDLLVNTTVLGMTGKAPLSFHLDDLPKSALVTDIVYAPLKTDLLNRASDRGHPIVDGLGMLLHQARPGFQAWFGTDPKVDEDLRQSVLGAGA
ncbi:MAG: shikimate dehydrogenase [Magnetovibrionaceae bacterium]